MAGTGFRSPEVILMVVAGVAVAILGPYTLYRLGPHAPKVTSREAKSGPPGIDLDIGELDTLPDSLRDGAKLLLTTETPTPAEDIANLRALRAAEASQVRSETEQQMEDLRTALLSLLDQPAGSNLH